MMVLTQAPRTRLADRRQRQGLRLAHWPTLPEDVTLRTLQAPAKHAPRPRPETRAGLDHTGATPVKRVPTWGLGRSWPSRGFGTVGACQVCANTDHASEGR